MSDSYIVTCLRTLCQAPGVNGLTQIAETAKTLLSAYTEDLQIDNCGNILASIPAADPTAPCVLIEAHMDEIGFVVTDIADNGFLRLAPCGGVDYRCLAATPVEVWGQKTLHGVFCSMPPHLQKNEKAETKVDTDALFVDVGLPKQEVDRYVQIGDRVSFAANFRQITPHLYTSKAIDDRAGMVAVLYALSLLQQQELPCTVKVLFAVGEELGSRGATTGSFLADVQTALVTDVSFAYTPDAPRAACGDLRKGAMIGIAPTLDEAYSACLFELAQTQHIAFQTEVMGGKTGTDADVISNTKSGVRTALLSIPLRYMHTPVEMVDEEDIAAVGALMAAFIAKGGARL